MYDISGSKYNIPEDSFYKSEKHFINTVAKIFRETFGVEINKNSMVEFADSYFDVLAVFKDKIKEKCMIYPTEAYTKILKNANEIDDIPSSSKFLSFYLEVLESDIDSIYKDHEFLIDMRKYNKNAHHSKEYIESTTLYGFEKSDKSYYSIKSKLDYIIKIALKDLVNESGIYRLYSGENIVYIGKSYNLRDRIPSSFGERFFKDNNIDFIDYAITNKADADIYEMYYISLYKPELNGGKHLDLPSMVLSDLDFSNTINLKEELDKINFDK